MKVQRCRTCGKLGVGPRAVKLYPFEDRLYCKTHFRSALEWHEQRGYVSGGLQFEDANARWAEKQRKKIGWLIVELDPKYVGVLQWRGYIAELAGMASWALEVGDRRTFVHYFARALYAWELREA